MHSICNPFVICLLFVLPLFRSKVHLQDFVDFITFYSFDIHSIPFHFICFLEMQKIMEAAQNRSKKLGISSMSKTPLTESNAKASQSKQQQAKAKNSPKRRPSAERTSSFPSPSTKSRAVALRTVNNSVAETRNTFSIDAKENVDLALEINITTGPNVQVTVVVSVVYEPMHCFTNINISMVRYRLRLKSKNWTAMAKY